MSTSDGGKPQVLRVNSKKLYEKTKTVRMKTLELACAKGTVTSEELQQIGGHRCYGLYPAATEAAA